MMAMTACRECGKEISTTAKACPNCGASVPRSGMPKWLWVPIGLVAGFVLMLVIGALAPPPDEEDRARMTIKACWEQQGRKSNTPDTARGLAGACEWMEREFQAKYRHAP